MTDGDIDAVMIRAASTAMGFQFWGFGLNKPLVHRRAVIMSICCAMQQHLSLALRLFFCRSVLPRFIFVLYLVCFIFMCRNFRNVTFASKTVSIFKSQLNRTTIVCAASCTCVLFSVQLIGINNTREAYCSTA